MARISWQPILEEAARIVLSYDTGVTLRQLFYRLVAAEFLPNTQTAYKSLSRKTAAARRDGDFPDLIDRTRSIHRGPTFTGPGDAREWLAAIYRRDRTEKQDVCPFTLAWRRTALSNSSKPGLESLAFPILALGGYSSQTYVNEVAQDVEAQRRPSVLIYAGDFDPSGEDIDRDFLERSACFDHVERVALLPEQVEEYALPPQMGKATDSRAASFMARHGRLVQVELDALPPDVLRELYREAANRFWDTSAYEAVLEQEEREREALVS